MFGSLIRARPAASRGERRAAPESKTFLNDFRLRLNPRVVAHGAHAFIIAICTHIIIIVIVVVICVRYSTT